MKKEILIVSPDYISEKMAGPGIRYWNFAKELSRFFKITLFTPNLCSLKADFPIFQMDTPVFKEKSLQADVVIAQGTTLLKYPVITESSHYSLVIDLYDPFIFENFEVQSSSSNRNTLHRTSLLLLLDQLKHGDFFICASEKQRDFWIGMLSAINRINPLEYDVNKTMDHLIQVVPFGITSEPAIKNKQVMKGIIPNIGLEDRILLWGGGIWNWLDPLSVIQAMNLISKERLGYKLFFMGTRHPNPSIGQMDIVKECKVLSDSYGLTDEFVFFNDWVDYEERQNYLLEADIGLSIHLNHIETKYSFRTRILDYIWCELPVVSTKGDVMAETIERNNLGKVVQANDIRQLANAILQFPEKEHFSKSFDELKQKLSWDNVIKPLVSFCDSPSQSIGKGQVLHSTKFNKISYFMVRIYEHLSRGDLKRLMEKMKRGN